MWPYHSKVIRKEEKSNGSDEKGDPLRESMLNEDHASARNNRHNRKVTQYDEHKERCLWVHSYVDDLRSIEVTFNKDGRNF